MATKRWSEIKRGKLAPETIAHIESEAKDLFLAIELRERAGIPEVSGDLEVTAVLGHEHVALKGV
jgi:hypothetical protein